MTVKASADDLREIASGKASARDKREAGVTSAKEARRLLGMHRGRKIKTTVHRRPARTKSRYK